MKAIIFVMALALTLSVSAEGPAEGMDFTTQKEKLLKGIEQRLSSLQAEKNCVSAAQDQNAIKACREEQGKKMKEMKVRQVDEQIKRLQDEKARLNQKESK